MEKEKKNWRSKLLGGVSLLKMQKWIKSNWFCIINLSISTQQRWKKVTQAKFCLHANFFLVSFRFPPFFIRIRIRVGVEGSGKFSDRGPQGKMIQSCIRIRNTAYSNLSYISLNIMSKILNSLYSACKEISSRKILQDFFIYTSYYWILKVSNCIKNWYTCNHRTAQYQLNIFPNM